MLTWTLTFFLVALVAGVFGFTDIATASASTAQILFGVFLILFIGSLILGLTRGTDAMIDKGLR